MAEEGEEFVLIVEDGSQLKSSWNYTGKATATYPNGEIYEGEFKDGKKHGQGTYTYLSGDKYIGGFENDKKHGIGKLTFNENGEYHGYFKDGRREGEGVFKYANGDIYSGEWKTGKKEGKGTYIVKQSGAKLVGNWADGKLMKGKWILRDGSHFEGSFDHNMPKGKGIWSFKNGNKVAGQYVQTVVPSEDDENPPITLVWNTHK